MTESSILWGGIVVGDHGPYTAENLSSFITAIYQENKATQGPIYGYLGSLAVTTPGAGKVRVASGKAIVDGCGYSNTANLDLAVATPGGGDTNYYTLVLQKDYTAKTIRSVLLGPSTTAYPTVTQDAVVWEIEIAQIAVSDAGVITITDARVFSTLPMLLLTEAFADGGVALADINNGAIDYTKLNPLIYPYTDVAPAYYGTSVTSTPVWDSGTPTFVTQAGKSWLAGDIIRIYSRSSPMCYMQGPILSYAGTSLVITVTSYGGSWTYTYTDWNIEPAPQVTSQDQLACLSVAPGTLGIIPVVADGYSTSNTLNYKLQSNGAGTVPSFRSSLRGCKKSLNTIFIPASSDTEITLTTIDFDVTGYNISANRITIPSGMNGIYYIHANGKFEAGSSGYRYLMILMTRAGTSAIFIAEDQEYLNTYSSIVYVRTSRILPLIAGDELRLVARQTSADGINLIDSSLSVIKVG
jgi:hypothetical protein